MIILQQFMALSCNIYEDLSYKRFIICHLKEENIMRSNKICSIILSGIIAASTFASVSAAEVGEAYTSGVAECQIIIDNSSLDLNGTTIYSKNGVAMAPLRLIGEALGFEVIWNESGQSVFGSEIVTKLPELMQSGDKFDFAARGVSPRELDVISLVAKGLSNKEIAEALFLSEGTVRNYLSAVLDKLELRDRTQLAVFYFNHQPQDR